MSNPPGIVWFIERELVQNLSDGQWKWAVGIGVFVGGGAGGYGGMFLGVIMMFALALIASVGEGVRRWSWHRGRV